MVEITSEQIHLCIYTGINQYLWQLKGILTDSYRMCEYILQPYIICKETLPYDNTIQVICQSVILFIRNVGKIWKSSLQE